MAEEKLPDDYEEQFRETYKQVMGNFKEVNPTQADQERARSNLQRAATQNYKAFKELAGLVPDGGNNVPLVMATVESRNLAKEVFGKVMGGIVEGKDPSSVVGEIGAFLMVSSVGPLNMTLWEKYQREQIEAMVSEKV